MMPISPSSRHHQLIKYSCHSRPKADPGAWRPVTVAGNIAQELISVLGLGLCDILGRMIFEFIFNSRWLSIHCLLRRASVSLVVRSFSQVITSDFHAYPTHYSPGRTI